MPRPLAVTYEEVKAACQAILDRGESLTFARVYGQIGNRGGQARVSALIRQFQEEHPSEAAAPRTSPDLPQDLVPLSDQLLGELWKKALEHAGATYREDRAYWQGMSEAAEHEAQLSSQRAEELENELNVTKAAAEVREQTILDLETRLREVTERLAVRDEQLVGLREDNARLTAEINITSTRLIEAKDDLEKARNDGQKSRDEANVLRGQIEAMQAAKPAKSARNPPAKVQK